MGQGTFLLNISDINGTFQIDTGIVRVIITWTVYNHEPNVIYAVSKVLLPHELFRSGSPPPSLSSAVSPLPMFYRLLLSFIM
jgi:hypothetical protein